MHHHRTEHWIVVKGTAKVEIEKKTKDFVSSGIEWMPINKIKLDKEKSLGRRND